MRAKGDVSKSTLADLLQPINRQQRRKPCRVISQKESGFRGTKDRSHHLSTRQYARIVEGWARSIGLPTSSYATHSMKRTRATLIYRKTGSLRAVQLRLGQSKIDSTVLYLGVEVEDALTLAESIEL